MPSSARNGTIDLHPDSAPQRVPRLPRSAVSRCASWSAQRPWRALLIWLIFLVVAIGIASIGAPRQATDAELGVGQAGTAARLAAAHGLTAPAVENLLISARSTGLVQAGGAQAAAALSARLSTLPDVAAVSGAVPSRNGTALLLAITMAGDPDTAADRVKPLQQASTQVAAQYPGLRIDEAGQASIKHEFQSWLSKDISTAARLSVPVTLVILLIAFGALLTATIPVFLGLSAVASAYGLWTVLSQLTPDPGMVIHLIVLMGMAVGIDYSLFYLKRFREEIAAGRSKVEAVEVAAGTSGHSIAVSGIAVVLALVALYLANDAMFSAMATGAILVVLIALVYSVTVLPAVLVLLGRWVDRPRVPVLWRMTNRSSPGRLVPAMLKLVLRRPVVSLALALGALVALTLPVLGMSLKATQIADFPRSLSTMQAYDRIVAEFPDTQTNDTVLATVPAGQVAALKRAFSTLASRTSSDALFGTNAVVRYSADGRTGAFTVATPYPTSNPRAHASVKRLRQELVPATVGQVGQVRWAVGGDVASDMDYTSNLGKRLPLVGGFVLLLTFLIMLRAFRSMVVAGITVVLNLLSCGAAFGALCLVFQHTWADGLLGYHSTGHVVSWVPMLLFVVLSGLSLDYHVFVVSRIREGVLHGMTLPNAVTSGLVRTAGVVTSAAAVMIAVFSIFGSLSFVELKQIGVGLAVAIVVDATVIRLIALPAALVLLGEHIWHQGPSAARGTGTSAPSGTGQPVVSPLGDDESMTIRQSSGRP